jgi:alkaline phosphatase
LTETGIGLFAGGDFQEPTGKKGESRENLRMLAKRKGFKIVRGRDSVASNTTLPAILFGEDAESSALPWEMDPVQPKPPNLGDLVAAAIRLLDGPKGFFVMAEAGKIDWAGHANDARAAIGEVMGLDSAVKVALAFASRHPRQTLILVTADHETGGLSLGNGTRGYSTDFGMLRHQKSSKDRLEIVLKPVVAAIGMAKSSGDTAKVLREVFACVASETGLGRVPELALLATDSVEIEESVRGEWGIGKRAAKSEYGTLGTTASTAIRILNRKAGVGWTTGAHTSIPVPLYVKGVGEERFGGRLDNTDIPRLLRTLVAWRKTPARR